MRDILSLWRFPLDQVALAAVEFIGDHEPRCSISFGTDFSAMTIYNYGAYGPVPNGSKTTNGTALADMFTAMSVAAPVGGLAFIEQATFPIDAQTFAVPDQCNMIGAGGGGAGTTPFYHFAIDFSGGTVFLNCIGNYTSGGKYFRSLAFFGGTVGGASDTCINAETGNCRAVNCTFTDIPTAFYAQGDGCALEQSTIEYDGPISGTMTTPIKAVIISGAQCAVLGPCELEQKPQGSDGPKHCTGISIEGAEDTMISTVHLSDWNIGVDFSQRAGALHTEITNCEMQCWQNALNIQLPAGPVTAVTAGIKVTGCQLTKEDDSTDTSPVVVIDPQLSTGNTNNQLCDITLLDCTVINTASTTSQAQHGLAIAGGTDLKITGGTYSNNGGAGIAIIGSCGDVQIIGANLQPTYPYSMISNTQTYGLLVSGSPVGTVYVADCDISGYSPSLGQEAVKVVGTPTELLIYNCLGYNDQNTELNNGLVPPPPGTNAATCLTPYFGPSVIIYSGTASAVLHVFGQTITSNFGIVFLPSPYDSFYFTTPPTAFSWIGK